MSAQILTFTRDLALAYALEELGPEYVSFVLARQRMNKAYRAWLQTQPSREHAADEAFATGAIVQEMLGLILPPTRSLEEPS